MNYPYLKSGDAPTVFAWARQLIGLLNGAGRPFSAGPYADDAAAEAAGIGLGGDYYDTSGVARRRMV